MSRPQFTLRALLILMLAVACFLGGIHFERERRRREEEAAQNAAPIPLRIQILKRGKIEETARRTHALDRGELGRGKSCVAVAG